MNFPRPLGHCLRLTALYLLLAGSARLMAQAPPLLSYQGRLVVGGTNFDGVGYFKFALLDGPGGWRWINSDHIEFDEPDLAVRLPVTKGLYSVLLGDTNLPGMYRPLSAGVFSNPNLHLRVWFSPTGTAGGFSLLSPDQRIASVGYAFVAEKLAANPQLTGTVTADNFTGSGAGLTNLDAGKLTGTVADGRLPSTVAKLGATQTFSGANTFTSPANSFTGGGAGLTGINHLDASDGLPTYAVAVVNDGTVGVGLGGASPTLEVSNTRLRVGAGHVVVDNNFGFFSVRQTGVGVGAGIDTTSTDDLRFYAGGLNRVQIQADGSMTAGKITLSDQLVLPATSASGAGSFSLGGGSFLHAFGSANTFVGHSAGNFAMSGDANTALGDTAFSSNSTGRHNTAGGFVALRFNETGTANTALGSTALRANTIGWNNTAIGYGALNAITTSSNNIALGESAGTSLTSGNQNIYIGNGGAATESDTIRIGNGQTRTFIAGISGRTSTGGSAVFINSSGQLGTTTSSRRFKEAIQDMGTASDVLLAFRPVTFRYRPELDSSGTPQFGLIAEEVHAVAPDLVVRDAEGQIQSVRYEAVNAMLLNEFQKEHRRGEQQAETIRELKSQVGELRSQMAELAAQMKKLTVQPASANPAQLETAAK